MSRLRAFLRRVNALVRPGAFERDLEEEITAHLAVAQMVSGGFYSMLGVNAAVGRLFSPEDDRVPGIGGPDGPVAVISIDTGSAASRSTHRLLARRSHLTVWLSRSSA